MANNPRLIVIASEVKHPSLRALCPRHCERSEAISIGIATHPIRDCFALSKKGLAMMLSTEGEAVPAAHFVRRRPPHPSRIPPTLLVAIHIKPLRGLAEFSFSYLFTPIPSLLKKRWVI